MGRGPGLWFLLGFYPNCVTLGKSLQILRLTFLLWDQVVGVDGGLDVSPERLLMGMNPGRMCSSTFCLKASSFCVGIWVQCCQIFQGSKSISRFRFVCKAVLLVSDAGLPKPDTTKTEPKAAALSQRPGLSPDGFPGAAIFEYPCPAWPVTAPWTNTGLR